MPNSTGIAVLCSGPFWTLPYVPVHLAVHLYLTLKCHGKYSASLSSMSHSSELWNLRWGAVCGNPQISSQPGRSIGSLGAPFMAGI